MGIFSARMVKCGSFYFREPMKITIYIVGYCMCSHAHTIISSSLAVIPCHANANGWIILGDVRNTLDIIGELIHIDFTNGGLFGGVKEQFG